MMIFGGFPSYPYTNQISIVESQLCQLTRVGDLPMDFASGACNTFKTSLGQEETLLCFGRDGKNLCYR